MSFSRVRIAAIVVVRTKTAKSSARFGFARANATTLSKVSIIINQILYPLSV